jgi:hypothetical protein
MVQNLVLNNSDHNFSVPSVQLQQNFDQTKVVPTPGTDAAQVSNLRAQLESGALTQAGSGINAEYSA